MRKIYENSIRSLEQDGPMVKTLCVDKEVRFRAYSLVANTQNRICPMDNRPIVPLSNSLNANL